MLKDLIQNKKFLYGFLIFTIIFFALRFYALSSDPFPSNVFGSAWSDEGPYIHNARNKILFGSWELEKDLWNPLYISPVFTYLEYAAFVNLGFGTFAMRIVPALLALVSILIAGFLFISKNSQQGFVFFILLGFNASLVAFSRVAMLECVSLFFIIIILGLMLHNRRVSWFFAGFFIPFLFFSKIVNLFFIIAIPLSLLLYYFIYREREVIKNFVSLFIGGLISSGIWLVWLVPNIGNWVFMNISSFNSRVPLSLEKFLAIFIYVFNFFILNPIESILGLIFMVLIVYAVIKREKVFFIDFFLVVSVLIFIVQIILLDHQLRRFLLVVPIFILMATRLMFKCEGLVLYLKNKTLNLKREHIIALVIIAYVLFNMGVLIVQFHNTGSWENQGSTYLQVSKEISTYIPENEKVFGVEANSYCVENKIKPYFTYNNIGYANTEENMLSMLQGGEINYAILPYNIFDSEDIISNQINLEESPTYTYIKDKFKIIKVLNTRDDHTGSLFNKIYIYKRIE